MINFFDFQDKGQNNLQARIDKPLVSLIKTHSQCQYTTVLAISTVFPYCIIKSKEAICQEILETLFNGNV